MMWTSEWMNEWVNDLEANIYKIAHIKYKLIINYDCKWFLSIKIYLLVYLQNLNKMLTSEVRQK